MTEIYWAYVIDQGSGARVERASEESASVETLQPGEYVVTFPDCASYIGCAATLNNSVGFITAVPGDKSGLPANKVRVLAMGPGNSLEPHDFTVVAFVGKAGQEGYPARDAYSLGAQRDRWTNRLRSESATPIRIAYHPMGHLIGLAGSFPLTSGDASNVEEWFQAHAEMLGMTPEDKLTFVKEEPFYEFDFRSVHGAGETVDAPVREGPFYEFDGKWLDRRAGTVYSFEVICQGYPFTGMQLSGIVSTDRPLLRGVYNGFSPAIHGFGEVVASQADSAWQAAEQNIGSRLTRLSSTQTWFDVSWALARVPSTKDLHWRLQGLDDSGLLRYIFVRSADNQVVYATPSTTSFGFEVHQTHMNDASDILWDSDTLPNGCTPGASGCVEPALGESIKSRDILPRTVDLWYRLSSPMPPPFVWPFLGQHKAPLDNRGRQILAVVAHNGSQCSFPCRIANIYYFTPGTLSREYYGQDRFRADWCGHEYGHVILNELKTVHPGTGVGKISPPATFTEAMCDLIGIVTADILAEEEPEIYYPTGFQIGDAQWKSNGTLIDYAPVSWPNREGNCTGRGRERIGRAFYNAWTWVEYWYGNRPRSVRDANFRAWWIDIMRSFALVSDFPDIVDFYAATESRLGGYVLIEAGVSYRLALELENLGLQNGCY